MKQGEGVLKRAGSPRRKYWAMLQRSHWILLMGLLSFLFGCSESSYYKKGGQWHYDGVPINREAEPVRFEPIDDYFAKDERVGYYRGTPIYDGDRPSDAASFQVVSKYYAKDRAMVYYCDTERDSREFWTIRRNVIRKLRQADPATFRLLSDGYTARDKLHLFSDDRIVPVRDLESFELLADGFSRDKVRGYYRLAEVAGSDGASFAVLDSHYARDKARIYFVEGFRIGGSLKGVAPDSFKVLDAGYAKTPSQVLYQGKPIADADASSFAILETFDAQYDATDKTGKFHRGERLR